MTISSQTISPEAITELTTSVTANPKPDADVRNRVKQPESKPKKQGHFCVWHGLTFGTWLRLLASRPPVHWTNLPRLATITALSIVNSWNGLLESVINGGRISRQQIRHPPIFILGHWRSGTTLLHNLMALDPQFTYPNLYQVMFPTSFLLTEHLVSRVTGWVLPETRPMDNIPAGWKLPQEDEMAILALTLISPYLMLAHQGAPEKYHRFFDLNDLTPDERRRWQAAFLTFLKKLTVRSDKPIVLKSPSHTFRIPILLQMFPDAKFIYIRRDPYAVFSSGMHLRKTLFQENGLGKPNFEGMEQEVFDVYTKCIDAYEGSKHLIPQGNLHEVKFEDLESDPLDQMRQVYSGLRLNGWEHMEASIRNELPSLTKYRKNSYVLDEQTLQRVYKHWKSSFDYYGYPVQPSLNE